MKPPYQPRLLEVPLVAASQLFPVLLLTGPRQVGKTTLLRHLAGEDRAYVSLDDPQARELARTDPKGFLDRFPPPVLIDEIQYAPALLPLIKLDVDRHKKKGAYWLTGSQQFHLMKEVTESLAGRVGLARLLGFSAREADGRALDLPPFLPTDAWLAKARKDPGPGGARATFERIWRGSLPELASATAAERELRLAAYLETYLQRDLRDLAQVGDLGAFLRFYRACAARTAQLLNLSDLARDVDISVNTAKHWLSILVASYQAILLEPYHSNRTTRLVRRPKLYLLDTGLATYLTRWTTPETLAAGAMAGAIFETYAVTEILKSWWHCMRDPPWAYYRDRDGREIDLVFEVDGRLLPVEIKSGATPSREWTRAFVTLERFAPGRSTGAVVSLATDDVPLAKGELVIPVRYL